MLDKKLTRRDLLKLAGATAGSAILSACTPAEPADPEVVEVEVTREVAGEAEEIVVTATPPAAAPGRKVLRWWDNYNGEHPIGQTVQNVVFEQFKQENPGWDVEFTFVTNTEVVPKLITSRMAGEPPDLWGNFAGRGSTAHAGYCLPLQDFVKDIGQWDDMIDGYKRICTVGDDLIGYPDLCGTKMYIYRKDFFEEAGLDPDNFPTNWDDLLDALIKTTQYDASGAITRSGWNLGGTADWEQIAVMGWQNGGSEFDQADLLAGKCTVAEPEFAEAFSWMLDLKRVHNVCPLEGMTLPPGTSALVEGFMAVDLQGPWAIPGMRLRDPEGAERLGIGAPIARKDGGERLGLANANHVISVYADSDVLDAALALLEVYSRPENLAATCTSIDPEGKNPQYFLSALQSVSPNLQWVQEEPLIGESAYLEYSGSGVDVAYDHIGYREMAINIWNPYMEMALFGMRSDQDALETMAAKADGITGRILSTGA